uniref:Uncharacterized protein n=1 Tax=Kalanchoe fedtschenkoi TaxID=63787 RepID=A0A7N0TYX1_KALFE
MSRQRVKIGRLMEWWKKVMCPVRRLCCHVAARVKDRRCRRTGGGLLKLHDDIQTCGYEDVQVMWEMLRKSEGEVADARSLKKVRQQSVWRFVKDDRKSALA